MTPELKQILDQLVGQINNWNRGVVKNEGEFINSVKDLSKKLAKELEEETQKPAEQE